MSANADRWQVGVGVVRPLQLSQVEFRIAQLTIQRRMLGDIIAAPVLFDPVRDRAWVDQCRRELQQVERELEGLEARR